jgi:GT2 family glycosyltransferase
MNDSPSISVVVLNHNGRRHLKDCFDSLWRLDYPREKLELILVDNASTDGSTDFMAENFPEVYVIRNQSNVGFARGNNIGAEAAQGRYVAFLNNDTRVNEAWARELVRPILADESVVCTASKMVDWEGKTVDFVKGVMNFYGHGHQQDLGRKNIGGEKEEPILFPCGGSMLIDRDIFLGTGGFDAEYFIYFEDADLGWRLWLMGYRVIFVPTAITCHHQHATMDQFFDYRKAVLYERNALYTIIKNYGQETLDKVLPAALLLAARRMKEYMRIDGVDFTPYHITSAKTFTSDAESVSKLSLAPLVALNEVIDNFSTLMQKREHVQKHRRRSDAEIFELFGQPFRPGPPVTTEYVVSQYTLAQAFGIRHLFKNRRCRVLVAGSEPLTDGRRPSDDGESRLRNLCQALEHRGHEVLWVVPEASGSDWFVLEGDDEPLWDRKPLVDLVQQISPDIVVACGSAALQGLAGYPIPVAFYPCTDGQTHPPPAEHAFDLSIDGPAEEIIEPLDQFCRLPAMNRDLSALIPGPMHQKSFGKLFGEVWRHYRRGGMRTLLMETRGFVRRRLRR